MIINAITEARRIEVILDDQRGEEFPRRNIMFI